jgi:hypothetical protein
MSRQFPKPLYLRLRRIHELERAADDQRERLRLHTAQLAASVRRGDWWREAASGMLHQVSGNGSLVGGLVRNLVLRFSQSGGRSRKRKFPWLSTILAGAAAAGFASWWKQRQDEE